MVRAKSFSRNGARYVRLRGLDTEANYELILRISQSRLFNLVGIDTFGMRFRIY